jgi:hypothetical protein
MKFNAPKAFLAVAVATNILGMLMLCECPGMFFLAAAFAVVPAIFGNKWVRLLGVAYLAASIGMAIHQIRIQDATRQNAADANRKSEVREGSNANDPESR